MSKENQKATPSRDVVGATVPNNEFAVNLLEQLQFIGAKELIGVRAFFSEAFLLHTDDEVFDDKDYRREWATNINTIHALCICIEKHSEEQINNAIAHSISILKKESEATHA